ncbi:hypothetical protein B0A80_16905 [Flavobacterium tructae]|uniref:hypothetical protein n=1 Tax=Flavobacterium tructae TaxID=1114873 RepID=UPI000B5B7786|nr:hypothetical protein [Flavobacterium tructae]OXB21475.1 hypothetical protein B0A80_16905 [Flavobacterium tructae]
MSHLQKTKPHVFIIESLDLTDEENKYFEGEIISRILNLSLIEHKYYYIRTKKEFKHLIEEFATLNYRYLHISCHGSSNSIFTTFDEITFDDLSIILGDKLDGKRLFLSSCSSTNKNLADKIFPISDCYSVIGPNKEIKMDDAAIFWSSFYQVMFKKNPNAMKRENLVSVLKELKKLFKIPLKYFSTSSSSRKGWRETKI